METKNKGATGSGEERRDAKQTESSKPELKKTNGIDSASDPVAIPSQQGRVEYPHWTVADNEVRTIIVNKLKELNADPIFTGTIGSWKDSMDSEEILPFIR